MREDLLGYLLDALDEEERLQVERALEDDPTLREQLLELQRQIDPLEEELGDYEPPDGLAQITCERVARVAEETSSIDVRNSEVRNSEVFLAVLELTILSYNVIRFVYVFHGLRNFFPLNITESGMLVKMTSKSVA